MASTWRLLPKGKVDESKVSTNAGIGNYEQKNCGQLSSHDTQLAADEMLHTEQTFHVCFLEPTLTVCPDAWSGYKFCKNINIVWQTRFTVLLLSPSLLST